MFPSWFKKELGFMFWDCGGDLVIVLGEGGFRETQYLGMLNLSNPELNKSLFSLKFKKDCLVAAYLYKGEWHLCDLLSSECDAEYWRKSKPFTADEKKQGLDAAKQRGGG